MKPTPLITFFINTVSLKGWDYLPHSHGVSTLISEWFLRILTLWKWTQGKHSTHVYSWRNNVSSKYTIVVLKPWGMAPGSLSDDQIHTCSNPLYKTRAQLNIIYTHLLLYFYLMCMSGLPVCVCRPHVWNAWRGQKMMLDPHGAGVMDGC